MYTREQKKNLKILGKVLNNNGTKVEVVSSLLDREDLIIERWQSKKGVKYVKLNNNGLNLQLEEDNMKYYSVDKNNNIINKKLERKKQL